MLKFLEIKSPTLASHASALTDVDVHGGEVPVTPCTYPVCRSSATKFPNKPEQCDHETEHQYRHGNAAGSFLECRACGAGRKAEIWTNPVTKEEIKMFIIPLPPRPRPGAQRPKPPSGGYSPSSRRSARPLWRASGTSERRGTSRPGSSATRSPSRTRQWTTGEPTERFVHIGTDEELHPISDPMEDLSGEERA